MSSPAAASSSPPPPSSEARPVASTTASPTYQQQWRELLQSTAREAKAQRELPADVDPDQLAFELGTILTGTNIVAVLQDDDTVITRARNAIRQRLGA